MAFGQIQEEREAEDDVKGERWIHMKSKLPVRRKIKNLWDMEVYEYSTEAEARARTGRNRVGLKWIDINKGSAEAPRYRSRLVCAEVRHERVETIFSAACQEDVFRIEDPFLISMADVSPAHFCAGAVRDVHVRLSDEDPEQSHRMCAGNYERRCTVLRMPLC